MSFMRALKWVVISAVLVVVAAVLYLSFADLNWLKPKLESAMSEATGRELKIDGELDFRLLPNIAIVLENVSYANAAWGSQPTMATIGLLSGEVVPWSLVSGPVRIRSIRLQDVEVLLETNDQKQGNWALDGPAAADPAPDEESSSGGAAHSGLPLLIDFAEIRNILLQYREPGAEDLVIALSAVDITTDEQGYTVVDASGSAGEQALQLAARLGPEQALLAGSGINIEIAPVYGEYAVQAEGVLKAGRDAWRLQDWTASYQDISVQLDGSLARGPGAPTELSIKAAGPDLAFLDPKLAGSPIDIALIARLETDSLVLDSIAATLGKSDLSGSLQVDLTEKPRISGKLHSKLIDLTPFAGDEGEQASGQPPQEDKQDAPDREFVFTDEPLPFETLNSIDLDLNTRIDKMIYRNAATTDIATNIALKSGDLQVQHSATGAEGGHSNSIITLATSGQSANLDIDIRMRDLRLNLVSGDVQDPNQIPPIDMTFDFKSRGNTAHALASTATGRILLTQGAGLVENKLTAMIGGDVFSTLFSALNPFSEKDEFTNTECAILALEINNGQADITGMYVQGEKVKIVGGGEIDLNSEVVNLEFQTKARQGVGVSPAMFATPFVKLKGTLASPRVALDKKGVLLAAGTGGLSVLWEAAVGRITGGQDKCAETLAEVGDHPPLVD